MPTTVPDGPTLETLASASAAAPSIHNTQPWRFRFAPDTGTLEVRALTERGLRHTDPTGRALHVSRRLRCSICGSRWHNSAGSR
ncbi:hypothetical protein ACGFWF_05285 [Streptomyces sp. NPDC048581]|uniref:hypothetical protein n=1 Tax=Streptomyces sp. NPDC048581 TaxID=3365572 RepID=UPI0037199028